MFWQNAIYHLLQGRDASEHSRVYFKLHTEAKLVRLPLEASFSENVLIKC